MPQLDRSKLAKTLALTASPLDGEALASARAANRLVVAAGLSWQDVLLTHAQRPDGAASDVIPDPPVLMPDGTLQGPPYGARWLDTILWLMAKMRTEATFVAQERARWLGGLPHRIAKRKINVTEVANLLLIYRSYVPAPGPWTPR